QDLFVEHIRDTENGPEYEFENDWRPVTVHDEPIAIKGAKAEHLQVRETHHGPIVNDALGARAGEPLALAWTAIREPVVNSTGVDVGAFTRGKELVEAFRGYTIASTIYAVFAGHFARMVSEAVIGDDDYAERWRSKSMLGFTPMVSSPWRFQARLIELWDEADPELIGGRSWDDLAIEALKSAL